MSRRRSPSSPAGDDDPTPPRGTPAVDARTPRDPDSADWGDDEWDDEDWEEPNFLFRRALVVGSVVVVIAVVALIASRFVGGDDGGNSAQSLDESWDTTIVLERDLVRLLDRDSGDEVATYDSSVDLLDAQTLVAGDVLVTMTDEGAIELIDIDDGSSDRGRAGQDETLVASPDNARIAIAGPDGGGDATIVDTVGRTVFSIADVAELTNPLIFADDIRVNPAGTHIAVPVPNAFQSFVVTVADESSQAFAGKVIAISDELVVTEQPAGNQAEIEFHEIAGERLGSADVPAPQATMLTTGGSLLIVAADGSVRTVGSDGSVDEIDPLITEDGDDVTVTAGFPALGGTRLVLSTDDGVVVLDESGTNIGSAAGQVVTTSSRSARCVVVGTGRSSDDSTVLDLDDGSVVTTIESGAPAAQSVDGCTIALLGTRDNLVTDGEVVRIDAPSIAEVAPDGGTIVVLDGRDTELIAVGGDDEDPVEIADEPVVVRFGRRE